MGRGRWKSHLTCAVDAGRLQEFCRHGILRVHNAEEHSERGDRRRDDDRPWRVDQSERVELLEAARIDGAGEVRIFFTIVLRLLGPAMVTIFLFVFVATWNNFLLPLLMVSSPELKPVTLGLFGMISYFSPDKGAVMLGALLGVIPLIILFFSLQRFLRSGLAAGAVKG